MNGFLDRHADPLNKPGDGRSSVEDLRDRAAVDLADELEELLDAMTEEDFDPELVDAYLDALEEKAPMPRQPDAKAAYAQLQKRLGAASAAVEGGRRRRFSWRGLGLAAALAGLLFALMVGVQAAGVDLFGSLARWTEEVFHFVPAAAQQQSIREALRSCGIPEELGPTWFPEGFEVEKMEVYSNDDLQKASAYLMDGEDWIEVEINQYGAPMDIENIAYQKDKRSVKQYASHGRTFYFFSNLDTTMATWSDGGSLAINISGTVPKSDIEKIIDSIGE